MYAMLTAQQLGADLINLGFGGGAHCEPQMADYIASRDDWDFATLELGINMVNWATVEEFATRAAYFVNTIASAHRDKWIFCLDLFPFWRDLDEDDKKPVAYREAVREIVRRANFPRLVHIESTALLTDWTGLTSDIIHPAPAGMQEIARNLAPIMQRYLGN
jgi:lysophospholipase L1-like esterase